MRNGEKLYERRYLSPRPPPKISLKHDLNWSKGNDQGSTVEHRPVGKFVQQSLGETLQSGSSKPTQSKPNPVGDRTEKLVTQEIVGKLQGELGSSDRSGQPDREEEKHVRNHDGSGQPDREERLHKVQEDCHLKNRDDADKFNFATDDENIDFNISGIPDATVKRSQSFNIHGLIQRIASHPQQEAGQNDLVQHQSFNAFSDESKVAIMDAGNTEICEIINVEPKWQCKVCLKHCSTGIIYCTCGHLMTKILQRIESTSQLCLTPSPYRISTSESTDHTVTGMEKHLAVKITLRRINLQRNAVKRSTTASTTDTSATKPSGRR